MENKFYVSELLTRGVHVGPLYTKRSPTDVPEMTYYVLGGTLLTH